MRIVMLLLWLCVDVVHAGDLLGIAPELWDRPRTARIVYEQPAVRQALDAYLAQSGAQLVIHHAVAPDAVLEAEELRAWLMALAVDAARVHLLNDLPPGKPLAIEVTP